MKTSSVVALICFVTMSGFNAVGQPAMADRLPQSGHIAEALSSATSDRDESDKLVVAKSTATKTLRVGSSSQHVLTMLMSFLMD
jgi:hypothetical protein